MHIKQKLQHRGSILILGSSQFLPFLEFMFNPTEVTRSRGWNYGMASPAGRSSPVYGGGAGDEDTFQFTIPLDADRGLLRVRTLRSNTIDGSDVSRWFSTLSDFNDTEDLRPYIDAFKRLVLPSSQLQGQFLSGVPQRSYIDIGSAINGEMQIDRVEERLWKFSSTMSIQRADLSLTGHMIEESNVTDEDFMRPYTGRSSGETDSVRNSDFLRTVSIFGDDE